MISNCVAGRHDSPHKLRFGLGELSHKEKCCMNIVAGQQVKQAGRPRGVGAVVERERQLTGAARRN
jgi:hypothetical protein